MASVKIIEHHESFRADDGLRAVPCSLGSGTIDGRAPDSTLARIYDDRKILHRGLNELLRTMSRGGVKEQCVARLHQVSAIGVAIPKLTGQHIDDFNVGAAVPSRGDCVFGD